MKNRLKEMRTESKMTQEELGKEMGVSRQTIIAIESGKYDPSLSLAFKISVFFRKKIEDIFIPE